MTVSSAPSPDCIPPARLLGVMAPTWRRDSTSLQDVDQAGGHTGMTVPRRATLRHDTPSPPPVTQSTETTLSSHPTPSNGEEVKIRVFLRAPNHKYRINNLKAAKEGETGQASEAGASREELKLVKVKEGGWQAAVGNMGCPGRAVGQGRQEEHGATPGG